jgi:hypothetical protein
MRSRREGERGEREGSREEERRGVRVAEWN